jgi:methyl-accepting chemotaxis protein
MAKVVIDSYLGSITWEAAGERLSAAQARFESLWQDALSGFSSEELKAVHEAHSESLDGIRMVYEEVRMAIEERDRSRLFSLLVNDYEALTAPYFNALADRSAQQKSDSEAAFRGAVEQSQLFFFGILTIIIVGALLAGGLGFLVYRSILQPIIKLSDTIQAVSGGDYSVRSQVEGQDELGRLGDAFDKMLEDKVTTLGAAEAENERLNNSIIQLIRAVSDISDKDFTVKIPVGEDVTGAVAGSLNLLTKETAEILTDVRRVSQGVAKVAANVKQQSDAVIQVTKIERLQVEETAKALDTSAQTMTRISRDAQVANETADEAMKNTQTALEAVTKTVDGINHIRDTIGETEKRIKRLGERSQEITGIVNLINSIAERTQILALNASMHAASAGEAGRGFAVVANEVQRLAESAREATSEISTLIDNIRIETVDTVTTVNKVITEVAEGTHLAEQAGESMKGTQLTTSELVKSVQQIAKSSKEQAEVSNILRDRAGEIEASTKKTTEHLKVQSTSTNNLVKFSTVLLKSVSVFKLPDSGPQVLQQVSDPQAAVEDQAAELAVAEVKQAV